MYLIKTFWELCSAKHKAEVILVNESGNIQFKYIKIKFISLEHHCHGER